MSAISTLVPQASPALSTASEPLSGVFGTQSLPSAETVPGTSSSRFSPLRISRHDDPGVAANADAAIIGTATKPNAMAVARFLNKSTTAPFFMSDMARTRQINSPGRPE